MRELWETWQKAKQTALRFWTRLSWGASPACPWNLSLPGTSEGSLKRCATRRGPPFLKVGVSLIAHSCDDHPQNSFYFLRRVTLRKNAFFFFICVYTTCENGARGTNDWYIWAKCREENKIMRFWVPGARRKTTRESSVWAWLSQRWLKSSGMPHIPDLHQSLIMLVKCLMCQSPSPLQRFIKGNRIFALSFPELFEFYKFSS